MSTLLSEPNLIIHSITSVQNKFPTTSFNVFSLNNQLVSMIVSFTWNDHNSWLKFINDNWQFDQDNSVTVF